MHHIAFFTFNPKYLILSIFYDKILIAEVINWTRFSFKKKDTMKAIRRSLYVVIIFIALVLPQKTKADWWVGADRLLLVDGITALISTPQTPLYLIQDATSGESNWVSTVYLDEEGKDWIQAGWLIYWYLSSPWQYVEYCINCLENSGTYFISPLYAYQYWGTTVDYWVYRKTGATWCGATGGYERYCADNLHYNSVMVEAKSEIHYSNKNSLDTIFDQVRFENPSNGYWELFDNNVWVDDFPYVIDIYSSYHFHNYRLITYDISLPLVMNEP